MAVRHSWLVLDYMATISYRLGFFALSKFGGVHSAEIHDALWADGGKTGSFSSGMRSLKFSIYVRPYGPFVLVKQEGRISLEVEVAKIFTISLSHVEENFNIHNC